MAEPRQISDYQVIDVLGRGGMGVVYEAVHANGVTAAVKTVRVATESTLESIRREILMLRELEHPGVVRIKDHGVAANGMPWYAMELLRGRTLRDDLRVWFPEPMKPDDSTKDLKAPGRLRPERHDDFEEIRADVKSTPPYSLAHVATVFRKICEPLAYVHGQGVIHRDLSPGNIFLVGADEPVLFDFGLASQFHPDGAREMLEVGGYARGTAHYMAPEQARGEVVDARADIYALGCILFQALTGRPPFIDNGGKSVLIQHIEDPPPVPSRFAPRTTAFDELLTRMLAKAPRDRFGYVEDIATALEAAGAAPRIAQDRPRARAYTYRPRLAGRAEALAMFDTHMSRLAYGIGGSAVLIGESGAGKTRLAGEIATRAAGGWDLRVITGECEPVAVAEDVRGAPLHPLRPLLRAIADRCREGGRVEADRLLGIDGGLLAAYEPALAGFARTIDRVGPTAGAAAAARYRVLSVLRETVATLTISEPVLLVLDDLQWADELTLAFLRSLTPTWFSRTALFVLVTVRADEISPELQATLASLKAEHLTVSRLDRAAVGEMVRDMLALDHEVPALADYVSKRSEGNPLFAAEYLRIAVEDGVVERTAGRWHLSRRDDDSYDHLPTPGSVQELGRRRLRQLSPDAHALALAAAVLGRACDAAVLTSTAGISADSARTSVTELMQRHVVEEADGQLRFEHDSLRELAYAELTDDARRDLHRRAAAAVEERHHADADFGLRLAELAHHWEQAGDRGHAIDYLGRAADHALGTAAFGEARTLLERLLVLATDAPAVKRGRWMRLLGEASYALGDVAGLATHSRRALDELGHPLPTSRLRLGASITAGLAQQLWTRTLRRRSSTITEPRVVEAALASAQMTTHFFFNEDSLGLVGAALTAINLAEQGGDDLPIAEIYAQLGYAAGLARLGGIARTYFAQAHATAAKTRDTIGLIRTRACEAAFAIGVGAWPEARTASLDALSTSRSIRNPQESEDALTILGHVEFATGNYEASRTLATELRDSARARANIQHEAWGIYTEGRAALYLGDLDLAIERFDAAMPIVAALHDRASQILCGGMLASALARRGDPRARSAADACWDRIGGKTPPVFSITEGLVGLCDAYLELARTAPAVLARARESIDELTRLARLLPIAAPSAANRSGLWQLRNGSRRRAARSFRSALADAQRLHMPYDVALAHAGLAVALAGGDATDHADAAHTGFTALGAAWHLAAPNLGV